MAKTTDTHGAHPKILRKSDNEFRRNGIAFLDHSRSLRGNGARRGFREMKLWIGDKVGSS